MFPQDMGLGVGHSEEVDCRGRGVNVLRIAI